MLEKWIAVNESKRYEVVVSRILFYDSTGKPCAGPIEVARNLMPGQTQETSIPNGSNGAVEYLGSYDYRYLQGGNGGTVTNPSRRPIPPNMTWIRSRFYDRGTAKAASADAPEAPEVEYSEG